MNKAMAIHLLCRHAVSTMPSDITRQEELYRAIAATMPDSSLKDDADQIVFALSEANRLQLDFTKKLGL